MAALQVELAEELERGHPPRAGVSIVAGGDLDQVVEPGVAAVDPERQLADLALALEDTRVDLGLSRLRPLHGQVGITADLYSFTIGGGVVEHRGPEALGVVELDVPVGDEVPH